MTRPVKCSAHRRKHSASRRRSIRSRSFATPTFKFVRNAVVGGWSLADESAADTLHRRVGNHREHEPPHFHARYAGGKVTVRISDGYIDGKLPPRALALILEWWNLHREELAENWKLAKERK
ncbi:MAG TPA: DUF4160 domain-containing protein [Thermoanaerobaculia bacterium]